MIRPKITLSGAARDRLFRGTVGAGILFGVTLLETSFFPRLGLFGAVPDLCLWLTVAVGFFDGENIGAVTGLGAGLFSYFLGDCGVAVSILFYTLCGVGAGAVRYRLRTRPFFSYALFEVAFCLIKGLWNLILCLFGSAVPHPGGAILQTVLPEFAATLLPALILFVPARAVAKVLRPKAEKERR